MPKAGDSFTNRMGEQLTFRQTSRDTGGALLEVEMTYRPHTPLPPAHYHPLQEERFQVLSGEIHVIIGPHARVYQAGQEFTIPANTSHAMHNISEEVGRVIWQIRPALRTENFFEKLWSLARDGKTNEQNIPGLLQLAVMLNTYTQEFRLSKPPYAIQRILWATLASLGRWRGYSA